MQEFTWSPDADPSGQKSVFDPYEQARSTDAKIVAILERLTQCFRSLAWESARKFHLSPLQVQFLIYLYYHPEERCRVSHLARVFQLTQATVSDAISTLERKHLIRRTRSTQDHRVLTLTLTPAGRTVAERLSHWIAPVRAQVARFSETEKAFLCGLLLRLVDTLYRAGVITVDRMCITCRFFRRGGAFPGGAPYYCALLEQPLQEADVRLDCPEHVPAS